MSLNILHGITILAASVLLSTAAAAQEPVHDHHRKRTFEEENHNVVRPHIHGPMIFRNTRYDNSYKHRNFSHQHNAYRNGWERRRSAHHCEERK